MKRILLLITALCFGSAAFAGVVNDMAHRLQEEYERSGPPSEETYIYHSPHTTIEIDGKSYDCEFYENENRWRCN